MTSKNSNANEPPKEILDIIEEIHENFSGAGKLIEFIESINNEADQYLKKLDSTSILDNIDWIKSADNPTLIKLLSNYPPSKSLSENDLKEHIEILKDLDFKNLSKISFMENEQADLIAAFLFLLIERFKEVVKKQKFPDRIKKQILVYMTANEMKSIANELTALLNCESHSSIGHESLFEISISIHRLGYLSGLLHAEEKFRSYHHSLTSRGHWVTGQGKHTDIENKYREPIRSIIQDYVKRLYKQGCNKMHNKVANEIRQPVVDFLEHKKSGKNFDEEDLDEISKNIIEVLKDHQTSHLKSWSDFYNVLKQKSKKDFFREAVQSVCPEKYIRGKKRS